MKAIFLDIDGVIATPTSVQLNYLLNRGPERQWYDGVALSYLGRLVSRTGAKVILSSNWRMGYTDGSSFEQEIMRNLFEQLEAVGAPVVDCTPQLFDGDRSCEVGAWLDGHPCEGWVIFDDLACFDMRPDVAQGHLVLIEESDGIRYQHFRQALEIFGATEEPV